MPLITTNLTTLGGTSPTGNVLFDGSSLFTWAEDANAPTENASAYYARWLYTQGLTRAQITAKAGTLLGIPPNSVTFTPNLAQYLPSPTPVELLQAYLTGREEQLDDVGAVARFFRDGPNTIVKTTADLKTAARWNGPNVTAAQIDAAYAAAGVSE